MTASDNVDADSAFDHDDNEADHLVEPALSNSRPRARPSDCDGMETDYTVGKQMLEVGFAGDIMEESALASSAGPSKQDFTSIQLAYDLHIIWLSYNGLFNERPNNVR